ncbi:MAG: (2Fe-2S)-binding protein [Gemmatimonadaceae bacterium]
MRKSQTRTHFLMHVSMSVNGAAQVLEVATHHSLLEVLRDQLHLTGTKLVCGRGECGACTVLLDGEPAYSCLTLAVACEGRAVMTIEGIAPPSELHPLQQAFIEHDALQCGFCTPGQILAAVALLREIPLPSQSEVVHWMSGNLCRCGAYPKIVRAILAASATMQERVNAQ